MGDYPDRSLSGAKGSWSGGDCPPLGSAGRAGPEQGTAHPHHGGALLHSDFEIRAHSDGALLHIQCIGEGDKGFSEMLRNRTVARALQRGTRPVTIRTAHCAPTHRLLRRAVGAFLEFCQSP